MVYRSLVRPILFHLPPETAHHLALKSLSLIKPINSIVASRCKPVHALAVKLFGLTFPNPVGLAAGFDKDGVALKELAALGFGHVEAGTVTYHAQPGNPKPRLFRLPKDEALINRAGFNNHGAAAFVEQVRTNRPNCVLGVSIGKSKITPLEKAVDDYLATFELIYEVADYIAINVSSPNTPNLRQLQQAEQLHALLSALQNRNDELQRRTNRASRIPLLVKLSPDLTANDLELIVDVVQTLNMDGIIATNTTISRDHLQTSTQKVNACGEGGLSGKPLASRSTAIVKHLFRLTRGKVPIIGVGGIFTAADAWEKIGAGASLVQLYTGFIYQGPCVTRDINDGLAQLMEQKGFESLQAAVGHNVNLQ
jgi:dihydroorotate dehydrogenase